MTDRSLAAVVQMQSGPDRAANLASVDAQTHDCAEGANVKEVLTHPGAGFLDLFATALSRGLRALLPRLLQRRRLGLFDLRRIELQGRIRTLVLEVQDCLLAHIDLEALFAFNRVALILLFGDRHEVAYLALEGNIGHQPMAGLGVDPRQVPGIGITVGVTVLHVKQNNEVVAAGDGHV